MATKNQMMREPRALVSSAAAAHRRWYFGWTRLITSIAFLIVLPQLASALTVQESKQIDDYLASHLANVHVMSRFATSLGESVSCVDINRQPAFNNPVVPKNVQLEPSEALKALLPGRFVPAPASAHCPAGSVEMRLPSREKIVASGGLKKYLSKSPDGNSQVPPRAAFGRAEHGRTLLR